MLRERKSLRQVWGQVFLSALAVLLWAAQAPGQMAELTAPAAAAPGTEIEVLWQGPDAAGDFIAIAEPGSPASSFTSYARTSGGNPARLVAPEAGDFELRYISAAGLAVLARVPLSIGAAPATAAITAPAEVKAGAVLVVSVTDPGDPANYITIVAPDAADDAFGPYARLQGATEVSLDAPDAPGSYEIRHIRASGQTVLARVALTVLDPAPAEIAPTPPAAEAATTGEPETAAVTPQPAAKTVPSLLALVAVDRSRSFGVAWSGPGAEGDRIAIRTGGADTEVLAEQPVTTGSPLRLTAPDTPGNYEIVYIDNASGAVLARRTLEVR